jgi:hypothetical protein
MYTPLTPFKKDFDLVRDLMREAGLLERNIEFDQYADTRFAEGAKNRTAWKYEPGDSTAQ